jgi:two-component system, NtrC family, nitrogen regulation sensor histidine kinase GlnL
VSVSLVAVDAPQLDSLSTALIVLDRDDRVGFLNAAAQTLLAVGLHQVVGQSMMAFVRDPLPLTRLIERARDAGEPVAHRLMRLEPLLREGAQLIVDCVATPTESETVLLEVTDTTRQQRINRETALLAQLDGNRLMVRQLAHEIKNPLGGLRGAAQLLERELPTDTLRDYTRLIIKEADRLRALVDNLLGPGTPPRKAAINPHEMVEHVYRLLVHEAPKSVSLTRDYDPSLPPVFVDRGQMIQTMLNLGRNAIQAVGATGRVTIRTRAIVGATIGNRRHRVVARIDFEDDGPGVSPDIADKIFYPLVTSRPEGTGLGLAVAQDLATRHGGLIEFDSRPGRTVFTLLLPLDGDSHG